MRGRTPPRVHARRQQTPRRCIACADLPGRTPETGGRGGWAQGSLRPGEMRPQDMLLVQHGATGEALRAGMAASQSSTRDGQSQGRAPARPRPDLTSTGASLDRQSLRRPSPVRAAFEKALKAKQTARCQRQRSPGVRDHRFCKKQTAQAGSVPPAPTSQARAPPHKLSLLEVVLAPSSTSRAQSRRSQLSAGPPSAPSIQGCAEIWSSEGRSEGRRDRHH